MKIAIFSTDNLDVSKGIDQLITKYSEQSPEILFPVKVGQDDFSQSIIRKCLENRVKVSVYFKDATNLDHLLKQSDDITICDEPVNEVLHQLGPKDAVGIVWTDSLEDHLILHTMEDLALDVWDITDGIDPIEIDDAFENMDPDELHDAMHSTFGLLLDMMAAYVATTVMESLGQAVMEHLEDQLRKNIRPFDDQE